MLTGSDIDNLISRLIQAESSGNPKAVGDGGKARGLMQIQEGTWKGLTDRPFDDAFDPAINRQIGGKLVERIAQRYNYDTDPQHILFEYNTGRHNPGPLPDWTKRHPNKIYREMYNQGDVSGL